MGYVGIPPHHTPIIRVSVGKLPHSTPDRVSAGDPVHSTPWLIPLVTRYRGGFKIRLEI